MCVAHGADQRFVGKTLSEVLELTSNHEVDGEALHERFKQAAEAGGDWLLVSDATGELAAATAEVTCWQSTEMPVELRELLREHAMSHLRAHKA
ncbi:hypothetical protein Ctob_003420 [Chrysochromulina tobinii]|uniref:Uncharacterized protein n=1 Tax=Chrysochromulina tobinii TaxID=1460289 RepID=A0A0M0J6J2_9EUKA|nr:hypothetical protein Ctob_003420 [Chrysochromulina tobinii]|eukprot:KOO21848.1 hypothetical protein Ctob_003420 [Chrysochromulina sp. CCMP291]